MYQSTTIILKQKDTDLFDYCANFCKLAKSFKNSVIFRCRQLITASNKDYVNLTDNELDVLNEFKTTENKYVPISKEHFLPGYYQFDYMFKATKNSAYYNDLPMQSTQAIIKECLSDFKSFLKALKAYKKDPSKFTGRPKIPGYIKSDTASFDITNQDAVIKKINGKLYLKLPKTKQLLALGNLNLKRIKEVTIKPFYDTYKFCIVTETDNSNIDTLDKNKVLGIDLGIDNIIATSNNCGLTPFVIKGNGLKAFNQWFNKLNAKLKSNLQENQFTSIKIQKLLRYRENRTNDFYNKCASYVVNYCIDNNIGTIAIGKNSQWKTNIDIGSSNNQNFCYIAHSVIINKIKSLAEKNNINVIISEESYTSKASFLDNDFIPVYGSNSNEEYHFSGKRVHRGLYISKNGTSINADVNGASNIIRKACSDAFSLISDFSYLYKTIIPITIS